MTPLPPGRVRCCDGEFCGAWDSCREARDQSPRPPAPALSDVERARVERFEAAETPAEVMRERVARAIWTDGLGPGPWGRTPWENLSEATRRLYLRMADAAIAAMRGAR